jgi:hypothetical protein
MIDLAFEPADLFPPAAAFASLVAWPQAAALLSSYADLRALRDRLYESVLLAADAERGAWLSAYDQATDLLAHLLIDLRAFRRAVTCANASLERLRRRGKACR